MLLSKDGGTDGWCWISLSVLAGVSMMGAEARNARPVD
jgi:hypothetical protein